MNNELTTWRELIEEAMENEGETFKDVVSCTLTEEELDVEFDKGYGTAEGKPFTLWTKNRVYFPAEYDGSERCCSVSRKINNIPTNHI